MNLISGFLPVPKTPCATMEPVMGFLPNVMKDHVHLRADGHCFVSPWTLRNLVNEISWFGNHMPVMHEPLQVHLFRANGSSSTS